jgi:flagellar motor component MotA
MTGLLALIDGQAPRAIQSRLSAFLSPTSRPSEETQTAA